MADHPYGYPLLTPGQAGAEARVNRSIYLLAGGIHGIISSTNTPPGSPAEGDAYRVTATATGAWAGAELSIAVYASGAWYFVEPSEGLEVYDRATNYRLRYTGSAWVVAPGDLRTGMMTGILSTGGASTGAGLTVNNTTSTFRWPPVPYSLTVTSLAVTSYNQDSGGGYPDPGDWSFQVRGEATAGVLGSGVVVEWNTSATPWTAQYDVSIAVPLSERGFGLWVGGASKTNFVVVGTCAWRETVSVPQ